MRYVTISWKESKSSSYDVASWAQSWSIVSAVDCGERSKKKESSWGVVMFFLCCFVWLLMVCFIAIIDRLKVLSSGIGTC